MVKNKNLNSMISLMFKYALVREPGRNFCQGITTSELGLPDYKKALQQHKAYCEALRKCGLKLVILKPEIRFPDGEFVEDTAVVTERCAVITRLGAETRRGEEFKIKKVLQKFKKIKIIKPPGTVDGGDILRAGNHFYIGLSERTNKEGANQLGFILAKYGYGFKTIPVKKVLHLKTGITYIGRNNMVTIDKFAKNKEFSNFNIIKIDKSESYSANCLLINNFLLIPKGFPKTKEKLQALGYKILEIDMSEFQKMDGGLTCLSILF